MLEPRIQQHFFESADLSYQAAETMARPIAEGAQAIVDCVTSGGRIWLHGRGASQAPAQLMAMALSGRFERERPGLAALVLGLDAMRLSEADAAGAEHPAVQQLNAFGQPQDVLAAFSLQPRDALLARLVETAHEREMIVVAITGPEPAAAQDPADPDVGLAETDVWITVPHDRPARICELQLLALHALCDAIDLQLLGDAESQ